MELKGSEMLVSLKKRLNSQVILNLDESQMQTVTS